MSVDTKHPQYIAMETEWRFVKALCSGTREVRNLGRDILPPPDEKLGVFNVDRFARYMKRAIYTNVVGRTKKGLSGAAFMEAHEIDLGAMSYLESNVDGGDQSLEQMIKDTLTEVLCTSREILVSTYPDGVDDLTAEQQAKLGVVASIKRYPALSLINWDTAGDKLTLAVLVETYNDSADEFKRKDQVQYRVYRLRAEGATVEVWRTSDKKLAVYTPESIIKDSKEVPLDHLPIDIIGAQNNDASTDEIPLSDIAYVNAGHFINSADMEESAHMCGQAMLEIDIGETSVDEFTKLNGDSIALGSNTSIQTKGGRVGLVQAQERSVYTALREEKMREMIYLGARLVEKRNAGETATAAVIDSTGQNSELADIITNIETAYRNRIIDCQKFMGIDGDFTFKMNRRFFPDGLDAQSVVASIQGFDRRVLARSDVQNAYRKAGMIERDRTNEDIDAEIATASPIGDDEGLDDDIIE